jgi:hypothetical protein
MGALSSWEKSRIHQFLQAIGSYVKSVVEGTGASVDNTDPQNPVVSAKISVDGGNELVLGSDSGLFVPPGTSGTVTSVNVAGGSTGLTFSGGPVTTSGTITMAGTLAIGSGGTGQTTANAALNALLPSQGGNSGKRLQTDGTNTSWVTPTSGTVTSVNATGADGITVSGVPFTTSGTIAIKTTDITRGIYGRESAASGVQTHLQASSNYDILRVDALGALGFGPIDGNSITAGSITAANLFNGAACSVLGRSANSSGVHADISMGTNDRLLGRVSNVVQSTQLTAGMVPNALITSAMLRNSAARSVIGRSANSAGVPADIASTGARTFLADNSAGTSVAFRAIDAGDFPTGNWIGASNGTATLATFFSLVSVTAAWENIGVSVTLPAAGTYLMMYHVRYGYQCASSSGQISARLYNSTDAAAVSGSNIMVVQDPSNLPTQSTVSAQLVVTVAASKAIRIECQRINVAYTFSDILGDGVGGNGTTRLTYVRLY